MTARLRVKLRGGKRIFEHTEEAKGLTKTEALSRCPAGTEKITTFFYSGTDGTDGEQNGGGGSTRPSLCCLLTHLKKVRISSRKEKLFFDGEFGKFGKWEFCELHASPLPVAGEAPADAREARALPRGAEIQKKRQRSRNLAQPFVYGPRYGRAASRIKP